MSIAVIADSLIIADGAPPDFEDYLYAYYAALDGRDIEAAATLIRQMDATSSTASRRMRAALAAETSYFLARYRHEPEAAREVLRRFRGAAHDPDDFMRAAAAIFLAEGRRKAAHELLEGLRVAMTAKRTKTGLGAFLYDEWAAMLAESAMPPKAAWPSA